MHNLVELSGRLLCNGDPIPFNAVVHSPEQDKASGDYFCSVLSEQLFSRRIDVYGISPNQAMRLAMSLLKEALTARLLPEQPESDLEVRADPHLLAIGSKQIPPNEFPQCVIQFRELPEGPVPVLFFRGSRVTEAWRIEFVAEIPGAEKAEEEVEKGAEKGTQLFSLERTREASNMLAISDRPIPPDQIHEYAIRFCQGSNGPVPVLYFQGKRVTKAWRIEIVAEIPEDEFGGNANTS